MGFGRVVWTGIVGMIFLFFASLLMMFEPFDLPSRVSGGLLEDINELLLGLGTLLPGIGTVLGFLIGAFMGLLLVLMFPIHWCLMYRPDDVMLLLSVTLPWIIACSAICAINAKSPGKGIRTCLAIGIGYLIIALVLYFVLPMIPVVGPLLGGLINGAVTGLTDLPYVLAVSTAILEGCLVGAVFGGFIGALKYKPTGEGGKLKSKKGKSKIEYDEEPTLDGAHCTNCGAKLVPGNDFCTNCGMKL
ncbi:MAG: zinc ribbon domain-containing protein [Candidatus Lokiarchaeota archaeon]|nr:zinc ribbon domain-containing protein [Candidatus Lokiarchaeota archaeon]